VVEHYISMVAHRVQALMGRIEGAPQPSHASMAAATLSEILLRILSRFFDELGSLHREMKHHPLEDTVRQVRTIHLATVRIVHELVEGLRVAGSDSPAASIIEAYAQIANLVEYGTQTLVYPTWDYNASYDEIMTTLRTMTGSLGSDTGEAVFSGAPRSFLVITYPVAEEEMVLRHAFIAHEIGHFIDHTEGWSRSILEEQVFEEEDFDKIVEANQRQEGEGNRDEVFREALLLVDEIAPLWIREVIADLLAVCVLGPAYLLAFDEVSLSPRFSSPQTLNRSHPPGLLRKEIAGRLTRELYLEPIRSGRSSARLSQEDQGLLDEICHWTDTILDTDPPNLVTIRNTTDLAPEIVSAVYATLRNAIDRAITRIGTIELDRIRDRQWFCTERDIVDALRLSHLISHGLTPTELYSEPSREPSFAAVMNSGWFHFLHSRQDYLYFGHPPNEPHPDEVRDRYVNLQSLIAKGVESLQFKREFLRRKGTA